MHHHALPRRAGRVVLAVLMLVLAPLTSCASATGDARPTVVVSFYPLAYVVERIAGDQVDLTTLTAPGQEPHDLEMTLRKTAELSEADLLVYGRGLQAAVDEAIDGNAPDHVVEALATIAADAPAISGTRPPRVIEGDPHFWLDPRALATVAAAVADQLKRIDPDRASGYQEGYQALLSDLVGFDTLAANQLEDCARRTAVTTHEAFGYFGYRYDLRFEAITGVSPEAEPSPARLVSLEAQVERTGTTTIFTEALVSPETAQTLADEAGVETAVLDPIEGLSDETAGEDYLSLLNDDLAKLRTALDCA